MGALITLGFIAPLALAALWLPLRIGLFVCDRLLRTTPTLESVHLVVGLQRASLLIAGLDMLAFGVFFALYGGGLTSTISTPLVLLAIYGLLVLVLNFPGFPLRGHMVLFFLAQLILPVTLVSLAQTDVRTYLVGPFVIFAAFWFWNLCDRLSLAGEGFFSFAGEVSKEPEEY